MNPRFSSVRVCPLARLNPVGRNAHRVFLGGHRIVLASNDSSHITADKQRLSSARTFSVAQSESFSVLFVMALMFAPAEQVHQQVHQ